MALTNFNWVASAALGVMVTMLQGVFICCHAASAGLPYHAAPQMTKMSVNKQTVIHQLGTSLVLQIHNCQRL